MNGSSDPKTALTWLHRLSNALLGEPQDREQLIAILRDAEQRDVLSTDVLSMLEAVLQLSELQVRDIMIPKTQMVTIVEYESPETFIPRIFESGHSRFPVLNEKRNEVLGIVHAKSLLKLITHPGVEFDLDDALRPAIFVPESKRLDVLLKEFRTNRNHMAIVIDEYGEVAGFVTMEDVIEQIVGDIEDEFDIEEEAYVKKHSDNEYIIKAHMPIEEFNDYFNTSYDDDEFDTIGGHVTNAFGYLPKRGESIKVIPFEFKIINADHRRVRSLSARYL